MPRGQNPSIETFLNLLFPWGPEHQHLYKSVTWSFIAQDGKLGHANYAAQGFDDLLRLIQNRINKPMMNLYIGTGTQRETADQPKYTNDGFPKAKRKISNIATHNSIYLDIDVGKDDSYATTEEAFEAVYGLCDATGLPEPTMVVYSGSGGLHVYWVTHAPMVIEDWIPLATSLKKAALQFGLKFDPQVTVNSAGILRIPETLNHKRTPPTQVFLYPPDDPAGYIVYTRELLARVLEPYSDSIGVRPQVIQMAPAGRNQLSTSATNFTQGATGTAQAVPIEDLAVNCGVFSDILARNGNGDREPLWNLALMAASFTTDPVDAAEKISKGDPRYDQLATHRKLSEKINARAANPAIGWPQCHQFSALHPACQTCQFAVQNKSPFHFTPKPQIAQVQPAPGVVPPTPNYLPAGYFVSTRDGNIQTVMTINGNPVSVPVFGVYNVLDAGIDSVTGSLSVKISMHNVERWYMLDVAANLQPAGVASMLAREKLYVQAGVKGFQPTRDFLVAWLAHLQTIKRTVESTSYGWTKDGTGFTFGEKTYYPGRVETAFFGKHGFNNIYQEVGKLSNWQQVMDGLIYGNTAQEMMVATAFAAPLIDLIAPSSVVVSCYSAESGAAKTTAMAIGQAVWGEPRVGMNALDDTNNAVMSKISELRHLPLYWDELRTQDAIGKVISLIFSVTQGKSKARLRQDVSAAPVTAFSTMLVTASNHGLSDTVYANTMGTEAGGARIFEVEIPGPKMSMPTHQADVLKKNIERNYGAAGAVYAQFLVNNQAHVRKLLADINTQIQTDCKLAQKERFWRTAMATLLAGAYLANQAGLTRFNLEALYQFLRATLEKQRHAMVAQAPVTMSGSDAANNLINTLLAETRGRNLVITERIHVQTGPGKPPSATVIDTDTTRLSDVWVQFGRDDGRIRLRQQAFYAWLRERKQNPEHVLNLLKLDYVVTTGRQTIGAGVPMLSSVGTTRVYCVDLHPLIAPGSNPDEPGQ